MALTSSWEAHATTAAQGRLGGGKGGATVEAGSGSGVRCSRSARYDPRPPAETGIRLWRFGESPRAPVSGFPSFRTPRTAGVSATPTEVTACTPAPTRSVAEIPIAAAIGPART